MTGNGNNNLIIGRQDGNIEVYMVNIEDMTDVPSSIFIYVRKIILLFVLTYLIIISNAICI